jgi:hypothetical protein
MLPHLKVMKSEQREKGNSLFNLNNKTILFICQTNLFIKCFHLQPALLKKCPMTTIVNQIVVKYMKIMLLR